MGLNGSQMILNTYIMLFTYEIHAEPLVAAGILLVISEVGLFLTETGSTYILKAIIPAIIKSKPAHIRTGRHPNSVAIGSKISAAIADPKVPPSV